MIGVAMAVYRPPAEYLYEQLLSIRNQTHQNWVCIITSDSPLAPVIADPRIAEIRSDARFRWFENPAQLGHRKNFEKAIRLCAEIPSVEAIACSDQDDVWYPEKLATCLDVLKKCPPLSLVHSDMNPLVDGKVLRDSTWDLERRGVHNSRTIDLIARNVVAGCAMLFDAELARRYPVIPDGIPFHDRWFPLVASLRGGVYPIRKQLFAYRQHSGNTLGITQYTGLLNSKQHAPIHSLKAVARACRTRWQEGRNIAACIRALPASQGKASAFATDGRLRAAFAGMTLRHLRDDPALARAALARVFGSLLTGLTGPTGSHT